MDKQIQIDRTRHWVAATLVSFACASVLLALFFSSDLVSWAYDLPEAHLTDRLILALETWDSLMQKVGLAGATESIRDWILAIQEEAF